MRRAKEEQVRANFEILSWKKGAHGNEQNTIEEANKKLKEVFCWN
jgi:hypothetical protein